MDSLCTMEVTLETSQLDILDTPPLQIPSLGQDCAIALGNRRTSKTPTLNIRKLLLDKKEQRIAVVHMVLCVIMVHTANITVAIRNKCLFIAISDSLYLVHM